MRGVTFMCVNDRCRRPENRGFKGGSHAINRETQEGISTPGGRRRGFDSS